MSAVSTSFSPPIDELSDTMLGWWEELAEATRAPLFVQPGWVRAWQQAYAPGRTRLFVLRSGNAAEAVVPVRLSRGSLRSSTNDESPLWQPIVREEDSLERLLVALAKERITRVAWSCLRDHGVQVARAAESAGFSVTRRSVRQSPLVSVVGSYEDYLAGQLSRHARQELRRRRRRLSELGEVRYEVHDGSRSLDTLLRRGFLLEQSSWKGEYGTAVLSREPSRRFYWNVARWAAELDLLRLHALVVDDRLVAFAYTLRQDGVVFLLKLAAASTLGPFGPGILMLQQLIEHSFKDPAISLVNLCGGNEPFKVQFATGFDHLGRVDAWSSPLLARGDRLAVHVREGRERFMSNHFSLAQRERFGSVLANPLAFLQRPLGGRTYPRWLAKR